MSDDTETRAAQLVRQYLGRQQRAERYRRKDAERAAQHANSVAQLREELRALLGKREADRRLAAVSPLGAALVKYRQVCRQFGRQPKQASEREFLRAVKRYGDADALRRAVGLLFGEQVARRAPLAEVVRVSPLPEVDPIVRHGRARAAIVYCHLTCGTGRSAGEERGLTGLETKEAASVRNE